VTLAAIPTIAAARTAPTPTKDSIS